MPIILGIMGSGPGAGKNAVGDILNAAYGLELASFAEELRKAVAEITLYRKIIPHDLVVRAAEGDKAMQELAVALLVAQQREGGMNPWDKPTEPLMRKILQLFGTEYARSVSPNHWVDLLIPRLKAGNKEGRSYVITDVRYRNEVPACDIVWYIDSPDAEKSEHESEKQITPEMAHTVIVNDKSKGLDHLKKLVLAAFDKDFVMRPAA